MESSKISKSPVALVEVAANRVYAQDPGRQMRGYLKLECGQDRGLVVLVMDNVKFFPKGDYVYKLLLAGRYRERLRYHMVGNVSLSAEGKGEGSYRINPLDLDGRGLSLSQLDTAIVAAMSTSCGKEPLHPVLKGVFEVGPAEPAPEAAGTAAGVGGPAEAGPSGGRPAEPPGEAGAGGAAHGPALAGPWAAGGPGGGMRGMQEPPGSPAGAGAPANPGDAGGSVIGPEAPAPAARTGAPGPGSMAGAGAAGYRSAACCNLERSKDYPGILPFKADHTGASWKKVTDPALFPLKSPGAASLILQYNHFLYGSAPGCHLLAVPGRCLPEEQPDAGITGFRYWQPILGMEGKAPGNDVYGYWIAAIDRASGLILPDVPVIDSAE